MTPEQWAQLGGTVLALVGALAQRKKQNDDLVGKQQTNNHNLAKSIADILTERVNQIDQVVKNLDARIAVHSTELNHTNQMTKDMRQDVAKLQASLPDIKAVLDKTLDFFERQKAKTLETHDVGQGKVAITLKKESGR